MKRPLRSPLSMTAQARMMLLDCLGQCPLLQGIDMDSRVTVVHAMYAVAVPAGSCILKQGEPGSKLYVIESGSCDVYVDRDEPAPARMLDAPHEERKDANDAPGSQAAPAPVATLGPKRIFGELALMHDAPRNATVLTREASVLWVLERVTFTSIVRAHGTAKLQTYLRLMRGVDFLAPLTEYERQKLAGAVEETFFPAGASVFQQGDAGDAMYVVLQGRLAVTRREGDAAVQLEQVAPGGYFGELALVFEQPRAATVTAVEASTCLKVDKTMFKLMLGPVVDYLATRAAAYTQPRSHAHAQQAAAQRPSAAPLELAAASSPAGVAMQDLEVVGTLGKGSFGFVQLVRDRAGALYALKSVSKQLVVQTAQQEHVLNEKYILAHLAHPFVIRLFQTYKSQHKLYFLTEAVMGGEVFTLLRRARCFPEHWTQFYAASVVLVLEYLHAYDVAYRDLKPENLLLDTAGFVRVCDFGFAKVVPDRTWTLCGTPDYLAPEIVASRGHGKSVDYWALGVLIFEMLASYPPFWDENQLQSFSKISEARYSFPSHFSPAARHLISALLDVNPNTRLGASADGAMRVRQHEFFAGVDWSRLYAKEVPVPHMPHVKSQVDTSNFTRGDATDDEVIPYVDDGSNWDRDF
jgi:cGMP-dependent protein kinase